MKFMKLGSRPDSFQKDGADIRHAATDWVTDIVVNTGTAKFYLHKFPLLSKCGSLQKMVEVPDGEINISEIPGGATAFEICAKFCYGMTVTLNAYNVIAARCAAEYLEMHESVEKSNLIYKIDVFLNTSVLCSWKDSIIVLQTTKSFLPLSEDLRLVSRFIYSIASKVYTDTSKVDWSYTYNRKKLTSENGIDTHWNGVIKQHLVPEDWWIEDLCELEMHLYKRVIMAIRSKGRTQCKVIGEALKAYTDRRIPGFVNRTMIRKEDVMKNQSLLETIVELLPVEKSSVSCSFLVKLMRTTNMLNNGEMYKKKLIKKIGCQLDEATFSDLLIPASAGQITRYDVEIVLNIVNEFVMQSSSKLQTSNSIFMVAKLIDAYLGEVAKDPYLSLTYFIDLADMLSGDSRPMHDELYHAIDIYLKEHPGMNKSDKKKICSLMDCRKLSMDIGMNAVQNDRLPLRVVVKILFFAQMRASTAVSACADEILGNVPSLIHQETFSYGSSRSGATTNTDDEENSRIINRSIKSISDKSEKSVEESQCASSRNIRY
ncbi:hypothetical protein J5N97_015677 [Dioscorea zingiberensis]|uniref:NPH3 domain-containing protein n=1 Tax=Dioscorea zingiberensis TaxID=325984 RepID=A0A9D5HEX9_9LILI|nr:hypothetical protein J5N97_015677 [Dioscorea zingiberensis]